MPKFYKMDEINKGTAALSVRDEPKNSQGQGLLITDVYFLVANDSGKPIHTSKKGQILIATSIEEMNRMILKHWDTRVRVAKIELLGLNRDGKTYPGYTEISPDDMSKMIVIYDGPRVPLPNFKGFPG